MELEGKIDAGTDGVLFTTIPYDKGWNIWVDGEEVNPVMIDGAFIAVPIMPGRHTVALSYTPEGLVAGLIISILSMPIAFLFTRIRLKG